MTGRFVEVFRDLASFSEVLQTQLELLLCERLTQTWVKVPALPAHMTSMKQVAATSIIMLHMQPAASAVYVLLLHAEQACCSTCCMA